MIAAPCRARLPAALRNASSVIKPASCASYASEYSVLEAAGQPLCAVSRNVHRVRADVLVIVEVRQDVAS